MAFKFTLEAEPSTESVDTLLDDVTQLTEIKGDLEVLAGQLPELDAVMENLENSIKLLQTNGSEGLEVLNADKSIENLLGITEDQLTVKAATEGLGEALKKAWEKFRDFVIMIWEKITGFFKRLFTKNNKSAAKECADGLSQCLNRNKEIVDRMLADSSDFAKFERDRYNAAGGKEGLAEVKFLAENDGALKAFHDRFSRQCYSLSEIGKSPLTSPEDKKKLESWITELKTLEDEISKSVETMAQFKQDSEKQSSNEALVHVVTVANAVSKVSSDDIYKRVQKSPDEIARAEAFAKEIEERVGKVKQLMADGKKTFSWIDKVFMYDKEKEAVVEGGGEFRTFVQEISGLIRKIGGKLMHADIQATSIVAKGVSKEMNFVKACNQLTAKASGGEQS